MGELNELRSMHLFAGIGGGLLADLILGHKPIIAVEWDKYACQVLRERAADGWFPDLSVWEGDVRLFDPSEYAGRVDCIHAGFPCQDISNAGKQTGLGEGTRSGLYREVLRIAGVVRPRFIFLENVSAILSNGLGTVLGDLAAMGYDAQWLCIRASDVGAPHGRDRWFALAYCRGEGIHQRGRLNGTCESLRFFGRNESDGISGRKEEERENMESDLADSDDGRFLHGQAEIKPAEGRFDALSESRSGGGETVESWNGGRPEFWCAEPNVGRVANGVSFRVDKLKGLGNAQVPIQAAAAFQLLYERLVEVSVPKREPIVDRKSLAAGEIE